MKPIPPTLAIILKDWAFATESWNGSVFKDAGNAQAVLLGYFAGRFDATTENCKLIRGWSTEFTETPKDLAIARWLRICADKLETGK